MLHRLALLVVRRARLVLAATVVVLIAAAVLGVGAFSKLQGGGFEDPNAESTTASTVVTERFGDDPDLVLVVDAGKPVDQAAASGRALTERLSQDHDLGTVASYWTTGAPSMKSADGTKALVVASIPGDFDHQAEVATDVLATYGGSHDGLTVAMGGESGVNLDVNDQITSDLAFAESIAIPLMLVLLGLAFGSLVAALLPLAIGVFAIFGTFAELSVLGSLTDVSIFAINLTTSLGLGLAVDYALLMVSRFREELAHGGSTDDAVVRTVETAGRTILFSASTVAVALGALLLFPLYFLRSFAYAGIGVILIAMLAALVVLPALLTVLGTRINAGRLPWVKGSPATVAPFWGRLAGAAMRRPALAALPVLAALLLMAAPLAHVGFSTPDDRVLPQSATSRVAGDSLRTQFTSDDTDAIVAVSDRAVPANAVTSYAAAISRIDGVERVDSSAGTFVRGQEVASSPADARNARPDAQRLSVVMPYDAQSDQARDLLDRVRALPEPPGTSFAIGGPTAAFVDGQHAITSRIPLAAVLIAVSTFVLLFLFTGSVLQPLRALVLNVIGLSATLGVLVWIFQDGHLAGWLGFTPQPLEMSMLLLLFCITFGLSMDYEVFVMSRIKEMHERGAGLRESVTEGLARSGRIVSMAAVILAVSFFAFGTSSVSFIQMFGLGAGIAVLVDATLIRGVLVPVAMRLMGDRAWWAPAPLARLHRRFGLSEAPSAPEPAPPVTPEPVPAGR
ncbi:MMPL family transporter [Luteipulveratus halotolerans]|uniref:Membrane protein n=1 Tax=Luteipulveratus halotolerans TaxID=1631356 RepID=A0A0L6CJZ6_9MICO|nr:MMPL family transporter [Luteipulveratus halotolerans]KNX38126.1 membrane protein [Luteipulveratus halotolerans]